MKKLKVRSILFAIAFGIVLPLYSYFWADTVTTNITDAQMTPKPNWCPWRWMAGVSRCASSGAKFKTLRKFF